MSAVIQTNANAMSAASSTSISPSAPCSTIDATISLPLKISFSSLLPNQLIHCVTFMTLREEMQLEQTNRSHRSLLHYGHATSTAASPPSSSSSSSQSQQAHSHHRRIRTDSIMCSLALYCGPTTDATVASSSSSSSSASPSAAVSSMRQLHFWNRGPGWQDLSSGPIRIEANVDYDYMRPEWLIPTQCGVVITRDMIGCESKPEAELRTPINTVGIGLAVEEEVERKDPALADARRRTACVDASGIETSGGGHSVDIPNTASQGYRNAQAKLREYQQQQDQSNITLGEAGVQLAQKAAVAYETEMRTALSGWSSSELRYLLHALDQCARVRAALDAQSAELQFGLLDPNSSGRWYTWPNQPRPVSLTPQFIRAKADFDTLRKPMFVLCRWSSPLTGSRDDARPTNAPSRQKGFITRWDAEPWSGDEYALKDWYSCHDPGETLPPSPFYPPLETEDDWGVEGKGGVNVESPELRLAQLSSLVHGCPWPFLTDYDSPFHHRLQGECRLAALHLIESCLLIPPHIYDWSRLGMNTPDPPMIHMKQLDEEENRYGTEKGARWRRVLKGNNSTQYISASLCDFLIRTLPGAFRIAHGLQNFKPYQELIMAPIAPGWVLAMVGGGRTDDAV